MDKILPILFLLISVGCVDFEHPKQNDDPWVDPTSPSNATSTVDTDAVDTIYDYADLEVPRCGVEETLAGPLHDALTTVENFVAPSLIEIFGADGCIDSRRRQTFVGENDAGPIPAWEWYETIDPSINSYVYVPFLSYQRSWSYGHRGELLRIEGSVEHEEVTSFHETFQYDGAGRTVLHIKQGDPLFVSDRLITETWQYNETGALVEHAMFDGHTRITYERFEYDHRDRPIERFIGSTDLGQRLATSWTYGDGQEPVLREDFDVHGGLQKTTTYEYEFGADRVSKEVQKFHDHRWRDVYLFDENGNELSFTQDEDDDGVVEYTRIRRYNEANQTTFDRTEYDYEHGAAKVWRENTTSFDDGGRLNEKKQVRRSFNNSREPRYLVQTTVESFDYQNDGWTVTMSNSDEMNPSPVVRQISHYTSDGALAEQWRDDESIGTLELKMQASFNERGAMLERLHFSPDLTSIEQWFYDGAGQLVRKQSDFDGDGVAEARTEQRFAPRFAEVQTDE